MISQREFLTGLKNLINAAKKEKIYEGSLSRRHLPNGICTGYALHHALFSNLEAKQQFDDAYKKIAIMHYKEKSGMQSWVRQYPTETLDLLATAEKTLLLQNFSAIHPQYYPTDYTTTTGLENEIAFTVNLPSNEIAGFLQNHVLKSKANYHPSYLVVHNGEHTLGVKINHGRA